MKIKIKNSSIENKIYPYAKIFQTLKVPPRIKRLNNLRNNLYNFRNCLKLFDAFEPKPKNTNKENQKVVHLPNPTSKSININKNGYGRFRKFISSDNFIINNNSDSNPDNISISNSKKDLNNLYMGRSSLLKKKNEQLLFKINLKRQKQHSNFDLLNENKNKNNTFLTDINLKNMNSNNGNHIKLRKVNTELDNFYENLINENMDDKNNDNYLYTNDIDSKSNKKILPPLRIKKNLLLNVKNHPFNNNKNDKKLNYSIDSNISNSDFKINYDSNINRYNTIDIKDNKKFNERKSSNLTLDSERSQSSYKRSISNINNKILNIFGDNSSNSKNEPEIKKIISNGYKLGENFKKRQYNYELDNYAMRSKIKYAQWKYGIPDTDKYFVDFKNYNNEVEDEMEKRKSFYGKVESVIKELKDDKENKEELDNSEKYGINLNDKKKKMTKKNEYWINEQAIDKLDEMDTILKRGEHRKIKEKENRKFLEQILFQCKKGAYNINNS